MPAAHSYQAVQYAGRLMRGNRRLLTALLCVGLLAGCASTPSTHVLLPQPHAQAALAELAHKPGAVATVITTAAEEQTLEVAEPGAPGMLAGQRVGIPEIGEPATLPQELRLPFESLALVLYTDPVKKPVPLKERLPQKQGFPEPAAVGAAERALPCATLDTELARAEALRWFPRAHDALPFTGGEQMKLHAEHFAEDVGITVLVVMAMAAGGGGAIPSCLGDCGGTPDTDWHASPQDYRWSVSALDARIEGLLRLKEAQRCSARATLAPAAGDLALLEALDARQAGNGGAGADAHARLAERTALFDALGPKPVVGVLRAYPVPAGEVAEQLWTTIHWYAGVDALENFHTVTQQHPEDATLVLTDQSLIVDLHGPESGDARTGRVRIPYGDIAALRMDHYGLSQVLVLTRRDGHVDSLDLGRSHHAATRALGAAIAARLPAPAAGSDLARLGTP